jgi:transcriptional regulator with XRE-family HTH domain
MFGNYFKEMRAKNRITLREFCATNGFDPGNISKIERGVAPPPKSLDVLSRFAESLGIKKGSEEWSEFFDRASACSGMIPPDMMNDSAFVAKLPLVFRALRGQAGKEMTDEQLRNLAEDIRRA